MRVYRLLVVYKIPGASVLSFNGCKINCHMLHSSLPSHQLSQMYWKQCNIHIKGLIQSSSFMITAKLFFFFLSYKKILQSRYIKGKVSLNQCYIFGKFAFFFATYQSFLLDIQYIQWTANVCYFCVWSLRCAALSSLSLARHRQLSALSLFPHNQRSRKLWV